MGHHARLVRGDGVAGDYIVVQTRGIYDIDRGHAPAEDPDRTVSYDRIGPGGGAVGAKLPQNRFAFGYIVLLVKDEDFMLLVPHANAVLDEPGLHLVEGLRVPAYRDRPKFGDGHDHSMRSFSLVEVF